MATWPCTVQLHKTQDYTANVFSHLCVNDKDNVFMNDMLSIINSGILNHQIQWFYKYVYQKFTATMQMEVRYFLIINNIKPYPHPNVCSCACTRTHIHTHGHACECECTHTHTQNIPLD